jgi:nicotinic acid mononucleotide adenylyltransferase
VISAKDDWHALEKKEIDYLGSWDESKKLIFPGTFNPLHEGHRKIQKIAEDQLQIPVTFEISISNVEKTYLSYYEIDKTIKQFKEDKNWVMTNAPSFSQKSEIFKDSTFIIGMDTLLRIFDKRYYKDAEDMESSLNSFISNNSQFMVFGRKIDGHFMTLNDIQIPENLKNRFEFVSETDFRVDLSSSEIKRNAEANKILT